MMQPECNTKFVIAFDIASE